MANRVRVYVGCSIDGFIAGPNDDLSWLPGSETDHEPASPSGASDPGPLDYDVFIAEIGALLIGRRTYDIVRGFDVPWPFGERPVLVATHRPLDAEAPPTVRAVEGSITELIRFAKEAAGDGDVYLDGGTLIGQAAEEGLIDDLTLTLVPVALGAGYPLFAGLGTRYALELVSHHALAGGMIQLRARPRER